MIMQLAAGSGTIRFGLSRSREWHENALGPLWRFAQSTAQVRIPLAGSGFMQPGDSLPIQTACPQKERRKWNDANSCPDPWLPVWEWFWVVPLCKARQTINHPYQYDDEKENPR